MSQKKRANPHEMAYAHRAERLRSTYLRRASRVVWRAIVQRVTGRLGGSAKSGPTSLPLSSGQRC